MDPIAASETLASSPPASTSTALPPASSPPASASSPSPPASSASSSSVASSKSSVKEATAPAPSILTPVRAEYNPSDVLNEACMLLPPGNPAQLVLLNHAKLESLLPTVIGAEQKQLLLDVFKTPMGRVTWEACSDAKARADVRKLLFDSVPAGKVFSLPPGKQGYAPASLAQLNQVAVLGSLRAGTELLPAQLAKQSVKKLTDGAQLDPLARLREAWKGPAESLPPLLRLPAPTSMQVQSLIALVSGMAFQQPNRLDPAVWSTILVRIDSLLLVQMAAGPGAEQVANLARALYVEPAHTALDRAARSDKQPLLESFQVYVELPARVVCNAWLEVAGSIRHMDAQCGQTVL